ncbi:MAG: hypothetical protein A2Y06_03365 [Omnitrophica WOR_2 bacterium GWA2_37_7]|nr:MAG: hypothetical protein A2Y06_03365 [Omnitrophica WOR_2 bacterium GWA2_37_7]
MEAFTQAGKPLEVILVTEDPRPRLPFETQVMGAPIKLEVLGDEYLNEIRLKISEEDHETLSIVPETYKIDRIYLLSDDGYNFFTSNRSLHLERLGNGPSDSYRFMYFYFESPHVPHKVGVGGMTRGPETTPQIF